MIRNMKKGMVLVAAIGVLSAMAVPSMASAATWGVIGTNHTITSSGIGVTFAVPGGIQGMLCTGGPTFGANVASASFVNLTSASNFSCTGTSGMANCNIAAAPTGLPWTAQGVSTSNVKLNSVNITLTFSGVGCAWTGNTWNLYGTLNGGAWASATHSVGYSNATGLLFKTSGMPAGSGWAATLSSSQFLRDQQQTLTLV